VYLSFTLRFNIHPLLPDFFQYPSEHRKKISHSVCSQVRRLCLTSRRKAKKKGRRRADFFQQMLALPTSFIVMPGPRVLFIFPTTLDVHGDSGSFNCSSTTLRGDFDDGLSWHFTKRLLQYELKTDMRRVCQGRLTPKWWCSIGHETTLSFTEGLPQPFVGSGHDDMIPGIPYCIGTNQPFWCKGTQ